MKKILFILALSLTLFSSYHASSQNTPKMPGQWVKIISGNLVADYHMKQNGIDSLALGDKVWLGVKNIYSKITGRKNEEIVDIISCEEKPKSHLNLCFRQGVVKKIYLVK